MAPAHPLAATAERPRCLDSPPLTTTALDTLPAGACRERLPLPPCIGSPHRLVRVAPRRSWGARPGVRASVASDSPLVFLVGCSPDAAPARWQARRSGSPAPWLPPTTAPADASGPVGWFEIRQTADGVVRDLPAGW